LRKIIAVAYYLPLLRSNQITPLNDAVGPDDNGVLAWSFFVDVAGPGRLQQMQLF
jgi:hypothetical protein